MKKFFFFASVAIAALASCAKTQVVYTGEQQEISFRQITGAMTKANTPLDAAVTLGVFANYEDADSYFADHAFTNQPSTDTWTGGKFWPYEGSLAFTIYAPKGTAEYDNTTKTLSITATNSADLLYGSERYVGKTKADNNLPVYLKHACAWIDVNITGDDVFTVTSLTLKDYNASGKLDVVYDAATPYAANTCTVSDKVTGDHTYTTLPSGALSSEAHAFESVYVLPGEQQKFVITFTQEGITSGGTATVFEKEIPLLGNWNSNTHYVYNMSIKGTEIILVPAEEPWATPAVEETFDEIK